MNVLKVILIVFEVVLLFNLVILVHELGHFLAARWRGLKVERFGIWFGKPLWEKKINGVTYCLGTIPAGGYVALPQMAPMETIEGKNESGEDLPPISPLDKIIVAFAGPLFSVLLAFAFAAIVWGVGQPVSERETTTVIGYVQPFMDEDRTIPSPAAKAGLQPGDKILEIDGVPVRKFRGMGNDSVTWRIVRSEGETIQLRVERDGEILDFHPVPVKAKTQRWQRKSLRQIGIDGAFTPMIARVAPHSPAAMANLQANDLIIEANGERILYSADIARILSQAGASPIHLRVIRNGNPLDVTITPEIPISGEQVPRIGIHWDMTGKMDLMYPGPIEQVRSSVKLMIDTFGALFSPKSDIGPQHLSGPVGIMRIYYLLFESDQGWRLAIWFSVILNINLAILNLLPIPVLDGGHITLALIEGIRRRPINVRVLNLVQTACAMLVIGYILYVTFYDVQDLKPDRQEPAPEMQFAPKPDQPGPAPNRE